MVSKSLLTLEGAVVGIETVGLQHRDPTGSFALGLGGRLAGALIDRLRGSQTFGNVMLYIRVVLGGARLDPFGLVEPRDDEDERQEPTIAAKVSPSRKFMPPPVPPPGEPAVCSGTTLMTKSPWGRKPKDYPVPAFGATSPARRAAPPGECDLASSKRPVRTRGG